MCCVREWRRTLMSIWMLFIAVDSRQQEQKKERGREEKPSNYANLLPCKCCLDPNSDRINGMKHYVLHFICFSYCQQMPTNSEVHVCNAMMMEVYRKELIELMNWTIKREYVCASGSDMPNGVPCTVCTINRLEIFYASICIYGN